MSLESRYRRLLRIYPRAYRDRRGEEMLATLLEGASPDQTRPSRRDVADLVSGAARERLGLHAVPAAAQGLRIATPAFLVITAGFATSDWLAGTRSPMSTVVAAAWLLAILIRLALPRTGATPVALAVAITLAATIGAAIGSTGVDTDPRHVIFDAPAPRLSLILLCGLIGWVGLTLPPPGPALGPTALSPRQVRLAVTIAVLGLTGLTAVTDGVGRTPQADGWPYLPYPSWTLALWTVPLVLGLAGLVVLIRRRHTAWLWSALLLLIPAAATTSIVSLLYVGFYSPLGSLMYFFLSGTGIALVISAMVVVIALLAARNNTARDNADLSTTDGHRPARPNSDGLAALTAAGALAQGAVIAVSLYLATAAAYLGASSTDILRLAFVAVMAGAALFLPSWAHRPLISLTLVAVVAAVYSGAPLVGIDLLLTMAAVLLVVLPAWGQRDPANNNAGIQRRSRIRTAALAMVSTSVGIPLLTWYATGELFTNGNDGYLSPVFAPAVTGILLVPTAYWAAMVVVRSAHGWIGATLALAGSLAWITVVIGGISDSRGIAAVIALVVLSTLSLRLLRRRLGTRIAPA